MKILQKLASVVAMSMMLVSCHNEVESTTTEPLAYDTLQEVSISLSSDVTRTTIGEDGISTQWVVGDELAVWAEDGDGNSVFDNTKFMLRYFSTEWNKAYFVGNIAAMPEADYTYYLSYPSPNAVEGTKATYNIPSLQSGKYDGKYDIMVAEPVVDGSLTMNKNMTLNTVMRHQMHALKITVPEKSGNFDNKVHALDITFPNAVVGDITLDVADPDAAPVYTNTSNTVRVESAEGFDVGSDIWVFVLPGMVSGDVSYEIKGSAQRSEVATYALEREFVRGHVTPIRMAMPPFAKYTALHFSIGNNYLGEDFNFFTLYDHNGTNLGTFQRNSENRYTFVYEGELDVTPYNNTNWTLVFDTENAVVENTVNVGTLRAYFENTITPVDVPYLLYEDFENVSESESYGNNSYSSGEEREQPGVSLDGAMPTNGWNAARYWLKPGAIRVNARRQCVKIIATWASSHHGRLDTPPLGNGVRGIKPGKSVNVQLMFDAAMYKHTSSSLNMTDAGVAVATHVNAANPIDGIPTGSSGLTSSYETTLADFGTTYFTRSLADNAGDNAFGQTFPTYTTDFSATSDTRICFYPTVSAEDAFQGNIEINVYIDNIKLQIIK